MNSAETTVIFGGTGFIGTHIAKHMLSNGVSRRIVLVDRRPPRNEPFAQELLAALRKGTVEFVHLDVRKPVCAKALPSTAELVFNLAAIHREPGHQPWEYFETNLKGAENVCAWAASVDCRRMVFTSSISPYGPSGECKTEDSLPTPVTAYGSSKLAAEMIHLGWSGAKAGRKLLIIRPGVVFGPGEGGNVTRLIRSLAKGYFVYVGNRATRKAGGYVKELCSVIEFGLVEQDRKRQPAMLLNFSTDPIPTLQEFAEAISKSLGRRPPRIEIPRAAMMSCVHIINSLARPLGIRTPLDPVRVRKLWTSTHVAPYRLRELNYVWKFTLEEAFADWKKDCPADFLA